MAKSVTLPNGRYWKTQLAAKDHYREILSRYQNGEIIENENDHDDLIALLSVYDVCLPLGAVSKSGCGVSHFFRDVDQEHGGTTDCFYIRRTDGSQIDFSFHKAVVVTSKNSNA